jgi:Domain of unknown function (DUF1843)
MRHPVPPYGVAIREAISSGDSGKMHEAAANADQYLRDLGDVESSLKDLNAAIDNHAAGRPGGHPIPLYAVPIRYAISSGDIDQMNEVAGQAKDWLGQADEVKAALEDLHKAMGGAS